MRKQPRQERSEQTVSNILSAASQVIADVGVDAASTTSIAKHAGLSVGALYRFFDDKDAIVVALGELYTDLLEAAFEEVGEMAILGDPALIPEEVRLMVDAFDKIEKAHPGYFEVTRYLRKQTGASPSTYYVKEIDALCLWFSVTKPEVDPAIQRRSAEFLAEIALALMMQIPPRGKARAGHLEELEFLITSYVTARLT